MSGYMDMGGLISASGKSFELVKALGRAIERNGGDQHDLSSFLRDTILQDTVARDIIGGPWTIIDQREMITVDWESNARVLADKHPELKKNWLDVYSQDQFWFTDMVDATIPKVAKSTDYYKIIPPPAVTSSEELSEWKKVHADRLAVDRELFFFAKQTKMISFPMTLACLGNGTGSATYPLACFGPKGKFQRMSWEQLTDYVGGYHLTPRIFILMRA